jgi:dihydroorotate dehydrogenase
MGFNNPGAARVAATLEARGVRRGNNAAGLPVGISIGKTKVVELADAVDDYRESLRTLAPYADYVAVNVSSPNTPGLRTLQDADTLEALLTALVGEARKLAGTADVPVPIFVKVAPDLTFDALEELVGVAEGTGVAGLIATNTTLARDGLAPADLARAAEAGGLSGAPLTRRARDVVGHLTASTRLPVIASGGIMAPADAQAMFDVGAALVQLYTGFIYHGPALAAGINELDLAMLRA